MGKSRIGILTSGGDCPGLNAAIRGVGKAAILEYKMDVIGFSSGFTGLIHNEYIELKERDLSGIITLGGTILGASREKPFKKGSSLFSDNNKPKLIQKNYEKHKLDCLVCIGGNGTQKTAYQLSQMGLNVIGIPKTIDNDVWGTDVSFGFDSAVNIATEAIDRLHTTANSHKRIMVIEVMGHQAGWIALYSGIAGGGDIILIPEIEFQEEKIIKFINTRIKHDKKYSIVVVAEGIDYPRKKGDDKKKKSASRYVSKLISENTGIETRETVLGYIQRGGTPSPSDRILATRFGAYAAELIANKNYNKMVAVNNNLMTAIPLEDVASKTRLVPKDLSLIKKAKHIGTSFGN